MSTTMKQPVSDPSSSGEGVETLMLKLDDLFEQYLNLLDQYQTTRQQLSTQLSSGYMSLAQANFASTSRARYGPDYYDERMQASRRINFVEKTTDGEDFVVTCGLTFEEHGEPETKSKSGSKEEQTMEKGAGDQRPSKDEDESDEKPTTSSESRKSANPRDPLKWFGVLVPPPLRAAQSKFVDIVEGPVPRLVILTKELRALEIDIGRTKKSIKRLEKI